MRRSVIICLLLFLPLLSMSQETLSHEWQQYLERLSEEGEDELAEELAELYMACEESPININDTLHVLSALPFVSDLQRACLRAYIILYGPLASVEELFAINGFDSLTVELLRPVVNCGAVEKWQPLRLKEVVTRGHSNFVVGTSGTIEQARGYREDKYEGNDLRMMWRYTFKYKDRVQLQLSGDKDPGEAFFRGSQRQGFNFYGYSLVLNDLGRNAATGKGVFLRRVVLGQYHAQFGQGLTLWSGFGSYAGMGTSISRYAPGLRANGVFSEYGYLRGAAATLALAPRWELTTFYSFVRRAATLPRGADNDSTIDWVQSIYNSGYFRTQTEVNKQHQLGEHLLGGHLEYRTDYLRLGLTAVGTFLNKDLIPATYYYNDNAFRGNRNFNFGLDFTYHYRRLLLFGEASLSSKLSLRPLLSGTNCAILLGGEFAANNDHLTSAQFHYYSSTYQNLHAIALGMNSTPQNDLGGGLYYQGRLSWGTRLEAAAEFSYFPHEKYLVYAPSHATGLHLLLTRNFWHVKGLSLSLRYRYKDRGRNVTPTHMEDGHYVLEQTYRHQLTADLAYAFGPWRLITRLGYAHYHGTVTEACHGLLLYQDLQYRPSRLPLTLATRVALFDVDDYEARLYGVESDFVYQYSSAIYQNEGYRLYLLLRYDINDNFNIGFKYGVTRYTDRDTFGSDYDLIAVPHRQQWRIQLRLKW